MVDLMDLLLEHEYLDDLYRGTDIEDALNILETGEK